ncbi:MAG: TonB-dependent receptor, partial [Calditrichaeota bacterium]|nr:TonB-dependent receptor [Calditrichota bacterium]
NSIANSEVLFGPGSVIYGSDAIGGVMDFHTLSPLLREEGGWQARGGILTRYASANEENTAHAHLSLAGRRWGSLTSVTFSKYGDLRMGSRSHSGYRRPDYVER